MESASVTVSVVSHGQIPLVNQLLEDLARYCPPTLRVILTQNIPEPAPSLPPQWAHRFEIIRNEKRKGFGANHNAAFERCDSPLFCVANPDIRLAGDPFPNLAAALESQAVAASGPLVRDPQGNMEDSARRFPTAATLVKKLFIQPAGPDYPTDRGRLEVDWIAGMLMLFRADAFQKVNGFDERFFLYYEDVDICARLRAAGFSIVYDPSTAVIHDARRASRRNLQQMAMHATSALRYLLRTYQ
jgi:GT2 family glycosyltransferase